MKFLIVLLIICITCSYSVQEGDISLEKRKVDIIERLIRSLLSKNQESIDMLSEDSVNRSKRWNRQMFGCQCRGFHFGCRSDQFCQMKHGRSFRCAKDCCGLRCERS